MMNRSAYVAALTGALVYLGAAGGAWAAGDSETVIVGPELQRALGEPVAPAVPLDRLDAHVPGEGLFASRQQVKVDLYDSGHFRAGAVAPRGNSASLAGNHGIGDSAVGAFAEYRLDSWKFSTSALQATGSGQGSMFAVSLGYGAKLGSNISLSVGPELSWATGSGAGLFGSELGSGIGVRHEFDSGSRDVGAAITVNWHFLDSWNLTGVAGAKQLLSTDGQAPIDTKDALRLYTGVSVGYRF